jgi:hypothetical protein
MLSGLMSVMRVGADVGEVIVTVGVAISGGGCWFTVWLFPATVIVADLELVPVLAVTV